MQHVTRLSRSRPLAGPSVLLLALVLAHVAEHGARAPGGPGAIPIQLWVAAALLFALVAGSLALVLRDDDRAPRAAMVAGAACVVAPLAGHLVPVRTALSQPLWTEPADPVGWSLVLALALAGAWLALVAARTGRTNPGAHPHHNPSHGGHS
jgi:hypothetical protein